MSLVRRRFVSIVFSTHRVYIRSPSLVREESFRICAGFNYYNSRFFNTSQRTYSKFPKPDTSQKLTYDTPNYVPPEGYTTLNGPEKKEFTFTADNKLDYSPTPAQAKEGQRKEEQFDKLLNEFDNTNITREEEEIIRSLFQGQFVTDWHTYKFNDEVRATVEEISKLPIFQVLEFTKLLQRKYGLSDQELGGFPFPGFGSMGMMPAGAMVPVAGVAAVGGAPVAPQVSEEEKKKKEEEEKAKKDEEERKERNQLFQATLVEVSAEGKFNVLKEIRKMIPGMKLMESKEKVDKLPSKLREVNKDEGEKLVELFKALGGKIELRPI